jgi:glycine/D-amino acid oxidase-like deaminating enzyme
MTPDQRPLLGPVPGVEGLHLAAGFSGMGYKISPAVGLTMAELLLDGEGRTVDLSIFDPVASPPGGRSAPNQLRRVDRHAAPVPFHARIATPHQLRLEAVGRPPLPLRRHIPVLTSARRAPSPT